jgi:hypothetical protein
MGSDERSSWSGEALDLWARINAHRFEDSGVAMDFTSRLARDRGWSLELARAAVAEYRRFCFLAATSDTPVTPSEEVDEVWHAHLTYSRDYWQSWCGEALRAPLHHDPTPGGREAQAVYRAQYARTLALYEERFGPPPEAFWPATHVRFGAGPRFRTVDLRRALVLPRPALRGWRVRLGLFAAALASIARPASAALPWNPLDWYGPKFLVLALALSAARVQDRGQGAHENVEAAVVLQVAGHKGHHLVARAERDVVASQHDRGVRIGASDVGVDPLVDHVDLLAQQFGEGVRLPARGRDAAPGVHETLQHDDAAGADLVGLAERVGSHDLRVEADVEASGAMEELGVEQDRDVRPNVADEQRLAPAAMADDEIRRKAVALEGQQRVSDRARPVSGINIRSCGRRTNARRSFPPAVADTGNDATAVVSMRDHGYRIVAAKLAECRGDSQELSREVLV